MKRRAGRSEILHISSVEMNTKKTQVARVVALQEVILKHLHSSNIWIVTQWGGIIFYIFIPDEEPLVAELETVTWGLFFVS